jgi:hypothetical protein
MVETIARVAKAVSSTANRSPIAPTREAHDMLRAAVEEALAPVRDRLDELDRGTLEIISRVAKPPSADAALHVDRARERERRQMMALMAGLFVVNVATLVGVLAHCQ